MTLGDKHPAFQPHSWDVFIGPLKKRLDGAEPREDDFDAG
jgi:hypothetical protein